MSFLALLTGSVYTLGFITLRGPKHSIEQARITPEVVEETIPQETSPLLSPTSKNRLTMQPSVMELLHRIDFWLLVVFCVLTIGAVRVFSSILVLCS